MSNMINLYPTLTPLNSKTTSLKYRQTQTNPNTSSTCKPPIDKTSITNYFFRLSNSPSKEPMPHRHKPRKKSISWLNNFQACTIPTNNPQRVQRITDSINHYAYEPLNKNSKGNKEKKKIRIKQHNQQPSKKEEKNNNSQLNHNQLRYKHSNKNMAFKTLSVLYKVILDDPITKNKQEDFQLNASKFPIIDRFYLTKKRQRFRDNFSPKEKILTLSPFQERRTMSQYHIVKPKERTLSQYHLFQPQHKKRKFPQDKPHSLREDDDIFPWSIDEQRIE